ncbi:hypothetical protein BD309DRAFT_950248 [Dichomitus squalens]|nr:hypothetical protein BD309DRAFT_950248 [Dichomitus squalens]
MSRTAPALRHCVLFVTAISIRDSHLRVVPELLASHWPRTVSDVFTNVSGGQGRRSLQCAESVYKPRWPESPLLSMARPACLRACPSAATRLV